MMFEKEAEEYTKKQFSSFVKGIREIARISFKKGAEFGYNKANEWHWLILKLLIIFGVMVWIFFFPCELVEEDFCKVLLAYVLIFCIEKTRKYFKGE